MTENQVAVLTAQRDELLGMVRAVVDGVESVNPDNGNAVVETRVPKGLFARMVEAVSQ